MSVIFFLGLFLILILFVAILGTDGLWQNIIVFFNVLFAATLTMNFFEPVSLWLDYKLPTFSYVIDLLVFWGLFALLNIIFRVVTGQLSKVRIRFLKPVDIFGGILLSLWTGWIMVSLTLTSLHLAPLPLNSFGDTFQPDPESQMFFGLAPDRKWLALMHQLSQGGFSRSAPEDNPNKYVFDPEAKFILNYGTRRKTLESLNIPQLRVQRTWGSGLIQDQTREEEQQ